MVPFATKSSPRTSKRHRASPAEIATCPSQAEKKKTSRHGVFPGGHPSKYLPRPTGLNFGWWVSKKKERKTFPNRLDSQAHRRIKRRKRKVKKEHFLFISFSANKVKPGLAGLHYLDGWPPRNTWCREVLFFWQGAFGLKQGTCDAFLRPLGGSGRRNPTGLVR